MDPFKRMNEIKDTVFNRVHHHSTALDGRQQQHQRGSDDYVLDYQLPDTRYRSTARTSGSYAYDRQTVQSPTRDAHSRDLHDRLSASIDPYPSFPSQQRMSSRYHHHAVNDDCDYRIETVKRTTNTNVERNGGGNARQMSNMSSTNTVMKKPTNIVELMSLDVAKPGEIVAAPNGQPVSPQNIISKCYPQSNITDNEQVHVQNEHRIKRHSNATSTSAKPEWSETGSPRDIIGQNPDRHSSITVHRVSHVVEQFSQFSSDTSEDALPKQSLHSIQTHGKNYHDVHDPTTQMPLESITDGFRAQSHLSNVSNNSSSPYECSTSRSPDRRSHHHRSRHKSKSGSPTRVSRHHGRHRHSSRRRSSHKHRHHKRRRNTTSEHHKEKTYRKISSKSSTYKGGISPKTSSSEELDMSDNSVTDSSFETKSDDIVLDLRDLISAHKAKAKLNHNTYSPVSTAHSKAYDYQLPPLEKGNEASSKSAGIEKFTIGPTDTSVIAISTMPDGPSVHVYKELSKIVHSLHDAFLKNNSIKIDAAISEAEKEFQKAREKEKMKELELQAALNVRKDLLDILCAEETFDKEFLEAESGGNVSSVEDGEIDSCGEKFLDTNSKGKQAVNRSRNVNSSSKSNTNVENNSQSRLLTECEIDALPSSVTKATHNSESLNVAAESPVISHLRKPSGTAKSSGASISLSGNNTVSPSIEAEKNLSEADDEPTEIKIEMPVTFESAAEQSQSHAQAQHSIYKSETNDAEDTRNHAESTSLNIEQISRYLSQVQEQHGLKIDLGDELQKVMEKAKSVQLQQPSGLSEQTSDADCSTVPVTSSSQKDIEQATLKQASLPSKIADDSQNESDEHVCSRPIGAHSSLTSGNQKNHPKVTSNKVPSSPNYLSKDGKKFRQKLTLSDYRMRQGVESHSEEESDFVTQAVSLAVGTTSSSRPSKAALETKLAPSKAASSIRSILKKTKTSTLKTSQSSASEENVKAVHSLQTLSTQQQSKVKTQPHKVRNIDGTAKLEKERKQSKIVVESEKCPSSTAFTRACEMTESIATDALQLSEVDKETSVSGTLPIQSVLQPSTKNKKGANILTTPQLKMSYNSLVMDCKRRHVVIKCDKLSDSTYSKFLKKGKLSSSEQTSQKAEKSHCTETKHSSSKRDERKFSSKDATQKPRDNVHNQTKSESTDKRNQPNLKKEATSTHTTSSSKQKDMKRKCTDVEWKSECLAKKNKTMEEETSTETSAEESNKKKAITHNKKFARKSTNQALYAHFINCRLSKSKVLVSPTQLAASHAPESNSGAELKRKYIVQDSNDDVQMLSSRKYREAISKSKDAKQRNTKLKRGAEMVNCTNLPDSDPDDASEELFSPAGIVAELCCNDRETMSPSPPLPSVAERTNNQIRLDDTTESDITDQKQKGDIKEACSDSADKSTTANAMKNYQTSSEEEALPVGPEDNVASNESRTSTSVEEPSHVSNHANATEQVVSKDAYDAEMNEASSTEKNEAKNTEEDVAKNKEKKEAKNTKEKVAKSTEKETKSTEKEAESTGKEQRKNRKKNNVKNMEKNKAKNTEKNKAKNREKNKAKNKEKNKAKNTEKSGGNICALECVTSDKIKKAKCIEDTTFNTDAGVEKNTETHLQPASTTTVVDKHSDVASLQKPAVEMNVESSPQPVRRLQLGRTTDLDISDIRQTCPANVTNAQRELNSGTKAVTCASASPCQTSANQNGSTDQSGVSTSSLYALSRQLTGQHSLPALVKQHNFSSKSSGKKWEASIKSYTQSKVKNSQLREKLSQFKSLPPTQILQAHDLPKLLKTGSADENSGLQTDSTVTKAQTDATTTASSTCHAQTASETTCTSQAETVLNRTHTTASQMSLAATTSVETKTTSTTSADVHTDLKANSTEMCQVSRVDTENSTQSIPATSMCSETADQISEDMLVKTVDVHTISKADSSITCHMSQSDAANSTQSNAATSICSEAAGQINKDIVTKPTDEHTDPNASFSKTFHVSLNDAANSTQSNPATSVCSNTTDQISEDILMKAADMHTSPEADSTKTYHVSQADTAKSTHSNPATYMCTEAAGQNNEEVQLPTVVPATPSLHSRSAHKSICNEPEDKITSPLESECSRKLHYQKKQNTSDGDAISLVLTKFPNQNAKAGESSDKNTNTLKKKSKTSKQTPTKKRKYTKKTKASNEQQTVASMLESGSRHADNNSLSYAQPSIQQMQQKTLLQQPLHGISMHKPSQLSSHSAALNTVAITDQQRNLEQQRDSRHNTHAHQQNNSTISQLLQHQGTQEVTSHAQRPALSISGSKSTTASVCHTTAIPSMQHNTQNPMNRAMHHMTTPVAYKHVAGSDQLPVPIVQHSPENEALQHSEQLKWYHYQTHHLQQAHRHKQQQLIQQGDMRQHTQQSLLQQKQQTVLHTTAQQQNTDHKVADATVQQKRARNHQLQKQARTVQQQAKATLQSSTDVRQLTAIQHHAMPQICQPDNTLNTAVPATDSERGVFVIQPIDGAVGGHISGAHPAHQRSEDTRQQQSCLSQQRRQEHSLMSSAAAMPNPVELQTNTATGSNTQLGMPYAPCIDQRASNHESGSMEAVQSTEAMIQSESEEVVSMATLSKELEAACGGEFASIVNTNMFQGEVMHVYQSLQRSTARERKSKLCDFVQRIKQSM